MAVINADANATSNSLAFNALIDTLNNGFATGCVQPERHHHTMEKNNQATPILLLMPAWSFPTEKAQYLGVKIVNIFPDNRLKNLPGLTSTYILYNGGTGEELAILDGNTITARRTAATSALAARYLSRLDSKKLTVLGAGKVASLLPEAFSVVRPIEQVTIWNRTPQGAKLFAEQLEQKGFLVKIAHSVEKAVADADIVTAATLSTDALIQRKWLKSGVHVDLIGSFAPHMREADDDLIKKAQLYIDTEEAIEEAGDFVQPIKSGLLHKDEIKGTFAELARGTVQVNRREQDITLFKAVGSGLADLYAAKLCYETLMMR